MSEPSPQEQMTPPTLADNKANAGQNPTNRPTGDSRPLFTIGTET